MARVICYDPTGKYCKENKRKNNLQKWVKAKIEDAKRNKEKK